MTKTKFALNIECRTCFNASKGLNPLTTTMCYYTTRIKSYGELIEEVTKINTKYDKHPEFPQFICNKCLRYLKSAHKFIKQAKEVNEKLYSMLNKKLDCLQETQIDLEQDIEIKVKSNGQELEEKTDCLHEPQIDVETVLDIKVEDIDVETTIAYLDRLQETQMHIESTIKLKDENNGQEEQLIKESILNNTEALYKIYNLESKTLEETIQTESNNDNDYSESLQSHDSDSDLKESENQCNRQFIKQILQADNRNQKISVENVEKINNEVSYNTDLESQTFGEEKQTESNIDKHDYESGPMLSDDSEWKECKKQSNTNVIMRESKSVSNVEVPLETREIHDNPLQCTKCYKVFKNSKALEFHLKKSHIPEDQKCSCPLCGNKYSLYTSLYAHMRAIHGPETVVFQKKPRLESECIYVCDKCPRKYSRKHSLVEHKKLKHPETLVPKIKKKKIRPLDPGSLCPICGKVFTTRNHLTAHLRQHTGERPFQCEWCQRRFLVVTQLNRHRRQHTGDKPHKCQLCGKGFASPKDLRQHMFSHSDERPNKCSLCERRYKFATDLKVHMRTHSDDRPFVCAVCGDSFQRPNSLRAHRKIHERAVLSTELLK